MAGDPKDENNGLYQQLLKKERLLELALNSNQAGWISWDCIENKVECSQKCKSIFGFEDDADTRDAYFWISRVHPDDLGRLQNSIRNDNSDHTDIHSEVRIIRPDNKIADILITGSLVRENGKIISCEGIITDIESSKGDDAGKLKKDPENRRYLEAIMDAIPACLYIADSNGKILEVNEYARKVWGAKLPSSQPWEENEIWVGFESETGRKLHAKDWATSRALVSGEVVCGQEIDIKRFNGNQGTILNCAAPVKDENGKITGAVTVNIDITRQKEAERLLTQSKGKYQLLIEANDDLIWETDQNSRFTYLSPQLKKLWNIDPADLIGKKPLDLVLHGDKAMKEEEILSIKSSRQTFNRMLFNAIDGNGNLVNLEVNGAPFFDDNGMFLGYRGITRDITRQTLTETALKESMKVANERLNEIEYLYLNLPIGLCVFDLDLRYLRINRKLAEMNGLPVSEHIGKTVAEIVPSLLTTAQAILQKILDTGEPQIGIEFSGSTPTNPGVIGTWAEDWLPVRDSNGNITKINVMVVEKTEQKKAQEKLQIALDNGNIGIWEWDLTTGEVRWDERMERMFGLEPGTFDWTNEGFEAHIHEEDVPHIDAAIRKALNEGKSFEAVYRTKPRNRKSNYIKSKALITRDTNGKPLFVSGVCFDVTDMKEGAERSLIALNEALLRSNSDLQQFAYVASHDLQEPLRMVTSFTQLLQMQYSDKLDQRANEYINYAVEGSKRMYEQINALLTYSRVQSSEMNFEKVNLESIIMKVRENLMLLITETGAEIVSGKLPCIKCDEIQMVQLFQNLIENAIKFCKTKPQIRISGRLKGKMHIISINDNGIGIEPQYFDRVFRIFQRLHSRDAYKGTGIGLAICKKIVDRHHGEIWVESVPREGSTFYFSIPKIIR